MNLSDDDLNVLSTELPEDYTPPDKPFPWTAVILGVVGLAVVVLSLVILWVVKRNRSVQAIPTIVQPTSISRAQQNPEVVVEEFYLALSQSNPTQAAQYIDPRTPGLDPRVTIVDTAQKLIGSILPAEVQFTFTNLTYKTISVQGDQAQVRVVADLVIIAPDTVFDQLKVPWSFMHKMILIDGNWYIIF